MLDLESFKNFETLGSYFKYVRKKFNLSMLDVSEESYVSQPFISLIENNKNFPSEETLDKLIKGISNSTNIHWQNEKELQDALYVARNYFLNIKEKSVKIPLSEYGELKELSRTKNVPVNITFPESMKTKDGYFRFDEPIKIKIDMRKFKLQLCEQNGIDPSETVVEFY